MKHLMVILALLISTATTSSAWEWNNDTTVEIGITFTNHIGFGDKKFNEVHPYISISDKGWTVEAHINSYGKVAFGVHNCVVNGVEVGIVTGYEWATIQPLVKLNRGDDWIVPSPKGVVVGKDPLKSNCSF